MRWLLNWPRSQGEHCTAPSVEKWPAGHWSHSPPGPLAVQRRRAGQGMVRRRCMRTHCTHPLARRPRCWWRVSTQSACLIAHLCARTWTGEVTDHAWAAWSGERSRRARSRETSGVLAKVRGSKGAGAGQGSREHGWVRVARCARRGVGGRLSRTVAMSLAREDYTRAPRWRARARIVLFSRRERMAIQSALAAVFTAKKLLSRRSLVPEN